MTDEKSREERRGDDRYPLMLKAEVSLESAVHDVIVFDVSAGGAKVRLKDDPFKRVVLDISPFGEFEGEIIWKDDEYVGIKFHEDHERMAEVIREIASQSRKG